MGGSETPPAIDGSVVEAAPVPVVVYDADYRVVYVNDAGVAFAGADDRARLEGEHMETFAAEESREAVGERLRRVIEEREQVEPRELTLRTVDGERRYAEVAGGPVTYGGEPAGQAVLHDVTALKRREAELRRERDRLTALFDTIPEPTVLGVVEDGELVVARVNDAFEEMFGYDAEEVLGEDLNEYIVPEDRREEGRELDRRGESLEEIDREVVRLAEDGPREFLFRATPFEFGDRVESLAIYVDISEQKEREAALQRERDRFATLFETLPNPVVHGKIEDGEPVVERVNPAFEETFGYDADEVVGEHVDELTVPEDRREEARAINAIVHETGSHRTQVERETADGTREFVVNVVLEGDGEDADEGYAIYTDITEQAEREAALQRQNERLDEFAGIVSHDLRSPLSVAKGNLALYHDDGDPGRLDRIDDALDRMETLLEQLLTLARQGEAVAETEPVELRPAARRAWQGVETRDATLSAADAPDVEADPVRLAELLENLFRNAVEHGGDDVTVRVGTLGASRTGFYVADDGPGIPDDERGQVFEPGHTTSDDGTGFGLAIVETIAEAHDWDVRASDSDEGGARFEFTDVEVGVDPG